ncbi:MAG: DUF4416 family protein [Planctomycetia bacterium]|jgi:hypothetical protein
MGQPSSHQPTRLFMALFSRFGEAFDWARERAVDAWGPIAIESEPFHFEETNYYQSTMGAELIKRFWLFEKPYDQSHTVDAKLTTNDWEEEYQKLKPYEVARPLNLDPGYMTAAKLILSSTKNFTHRIYLDRGIFAELTLYYKKNAWRYNDFTFPDYRRADYHAFFDKCRRYILDHS